MSLVCEPTSACSTTIGPQYPSDPNVHHYSAPPGAYITSICMTYDGNGANVLGSIDSVTFSDGSTDSTCTGLCPSAGTSQCVTCDASVPNGIQGFSGMSQTDNDELQPLCNNGQEALPPLTGFSSGGSAYGPILCPNTHRLTEISGSQGCTSPNNCTNTLSITCTPLSDVCEGVELESGVCTAYCSANPGACDANLLAFCANPGNFQLSICGCSLPSSQYPILSLAAAVVPPIACDKRCQDPAAIKLAGSGTCTVGVICVQSGINITAVQSTLGTGITLSQTCGQNAGNTATSSPFAFLTSTAGIAIIAVVLIVIIVIIIIIVVVRNRTKRRLEEQKKQQLIQQRAVERQTTRHTSTRPTVVRLS
jgi:uncharacterized membrane protein